ncbi:angiotensin-converting enzyme-like isoform X2 [Penaeus chinensis]|uniref:angiotensin-converting enzyme-like isoform X2 n=1 Tax=Penaeus chinensis TaxID=139456 RepID=UPI001FB6C90F|nr:angiotensin-converting enzyme-like isoform X2 [Penaeus chinensis]
MKGQLLFLLLRLLPLAGLLLGAAAGPSARLITDETQAEEFMKELDARFSHECNMEMTARWEYITDVTDPGKEDAANAAAVKYLSFKGEAAANSSLFDYETFVDDQLYRRFRFLAKKGPGALDQQDLEEYKLLQAGMETIYSTATICDFYDDTECDLMLEPDIELIFATSVNWEELRHAWVQWRENTGKLMREDFLRFVELSNKAATLDGFDNTGSYWLNGYTVTQREADKYTGGQALDQQQFKTMAEQAWQTLSEGLYKKLHAYVRMRLSDVYPGRIDPTGPIPAHILGNMWAQDWSSIARHVMPFPEMPSFDVSESMVKNGWDIQRMFDTAEDFFKSIGLFPMTQTFWDKSVLNQTAWGRTIVCHASAEDFCLGPDGEDYRIKMCTEVNMYDLVTVHHEMGHIEYFMAYKNQPHVFRESANPGFHEAIGDLISLSVMTPTHLEDVLGLTPTRSLPRASSSSDGKELSDEEKRDLNFLMKMALEKIAFLPFGYLLDKYRWGVYEGSVSSENLNGAWWQLREDLQGVAPPDGARGEEYFDPGAKYHVPANVPYIRYFVSFIVQFQFHQRLCQAAGHTGPLHTCDIYNNVEAGQILRSALDRGFSQPWPAVLQELGGSSEMDPQAIIAYFDPLIQHLDQELASAGQCVGWGVDCDGVNDDPATPESSTDAPTTPESSTDAPTTPESSSGAPTTPESSSGAPTTPATSTDAPTTPATSTDAPTTPATSTDAPTTPATSTDAPPPPESSSNASPPPESSTDVSTSTVALTTVDPNDEESARLALQQMNDEMTELIRNATFVDWEYYTNVTDANEAASNEASLMVAQRYKQLHAEVIEYFNYETFEDEALRRQFELQKTLGTAKLDDADMAELTAIVTGMTNAFTSVVCPYDKQSCEEAEGLNSDALENVMAVNRDYEELKYYWEQWREVSGKPIKENYTRYITLQNKAAELNEFDDAGMMWLEPYTIASENYTQESFKQEIEDLWNQTQGLYQKLHAYVLYKLKDHYEEIDPEADVIPAHLLGNMWGQSWENIYELVKPYDTPIPNLDDILESNIDLEEEMFEIAEEFFTSINLFSMTEDFWENSLFKEPELPTKAICHASAWDFYDTENPREDGRFRIKMCTNKNQEDFIVIHHEMGHTQYQMAYSEPTDQRPLIFRDGANPGFHEAIGDTIALSVTTPAHLLLIADRLTNGTYGLTTAESTEMTTPTPGQSSTAANEEDQGARVDSSSSVAVSSSPAANSSPSSVASETSGSTTEATTEMPYSEKDINFLMRTALAKVAFLPYAYILDQYRWEVFADNNEDLELNKLWWEKRLDIQGLAPPSPRFPSSDFDVGAKYHVPTSVPYIRYFVAHILQFQFHARLCDVSGFVGDIYNCNIYNNTDAGNHLRTLLEKGASEPWKQQLGEFLGTEEGNMDASALLDYFKPLDDFLTNFLEQNEITPGWRQGQVESYMHDERVQIPATVPIVVGIVLAVMVVIVIIAYFVGRSRQKKKAKKNKTPAQVPGENIELGQQKTDL